MLLRTTAMSQLESWSDTRHGLREQMRLRSSLAWPFVQDTYICLRLVEECRSTRLRCNVIHGGYPLQHDICRILSGLYYTGTNTLITVYLQCDLQTINACNNRNPNLSSLLRLTHDGYVRTNIPPSQTRYVVQSSAYRALTHVFFCYTV